MSESHRTIQMPSTDDAEPGEVLSALCLCALSWEPNARIIGNIRAIDIVRACDYATRLIDEFGDDEE